MFKMLKNPQTKISLVFYIFCTLKCISSSTITRIQMQPLLQAASSSSSTGIAPSNEDNRAQTRAQRALYPFGGGAHKQLVIKPFAAIPNIQSELYEVYMEPFNFDLRSIQALVLLQGEGESSVKGEIHFVQRHPPAGPVIIRGNITGLASGKHGMHIHQAGDMRNGCEKLGEHYNPFLLHHGGPRDPERHVGDLGNVEANADGVADVNQVDHLMNLNGPRGVIGRALVITEKEDDYGRGGTADSVNTGSAGKSIACGIIAYVR